MSRFSVLDAPNARSTQRILDPPLSVSLFYGPPSLPSGVYDEVKPRKAEHLLLHHAGRERSYSEKFFLPAHNVVQTRTGNKLDGTVYGRFLYLFFSFTFLIFQTISFFCNCFRCDVVFRGIPKGDVASILRYSDTGYVAIWVKLTNSE